MNNVSYVHTAWYLLYYTYGILPFITGIDKFFDYVADWNIYVNPHIPELLHMQQNHFMYAVGIFEIALGIILFLKPRLGGYIMTAWLLIISINLISMGTHTHEGYQHSMTHYDVAARDVVMAVGSYVLVLLSKFLGK